jgi:hypothetical protein
MNTFYQLPGTVKWSVALLLFVVVIPVMIFWTDLIAGGNFFGYLLIF